MAYYAHMNMQPTEPDDLPEDPCESAGAPDSAAEDNLWFLPGPTDATSDDLPPGPRTDHSEATLIAGWQAAEAGSAARLAHVASRIGALDDRLRRGPEGWRHRLALIEAAALSSTVGDRVGADRLALWISLRLAGVQEDTSALARGH